ncbi:hypothetical protein NL676_000471 [Syzygium grande]|nr:hypothetical protein NL676_000471 [Syzygium grande]
MSGGGESEATRCSMCMVGTPVESWAHPANQQAATWLTGEAHPTSFHCSCSNAPTIGSVSSFANLIQSGSNNPCVDVAPLNAFTSSGMS